ncbi:MAG: hypothetical protein HZB53_00940 [Chloroflexi bacterium]|nr:hypothetical protein [Chloroflexota bacterium]
MSTRSDWLAFGFWLLLGAGSLFALTQVGGDYVASIRSLRDLRWRVVRFVPPTERADGAAVIEIQNRSPLDLKISQLELFVWSGNVTVGKTYHALGERTVGAGATVELPLDLVVIPAALADARARADGKPQPWALTGSYKVTTPLSDFNLLYRLNLEMP